MRGKCVSKNFMSADDLTFFAATDSYSETLRTLHQNINELSTWFQKWRKKASVTKTEKNPIPQTKPLRLGTTR